MDQSIVQQRSFAFALNIVTVCRLLRHHREYEIASQLLRSGTSIGANLAETTGTLSRRDFRAKIAIACKEASETLFWLRLITAAKLVPIDLSAELQEARELVYMLTAILKNTQVD